MDYQPKAGDLVLLRGTVTDDGSAVRVAPGAELPVRSVDVVCELPKDAPSSRAVVLFFANDDDLHDFVETFCGAYDSGAAVEVG